MTEHDNIDKLAKSLLMDFEADVPSHIWPAVEEQLIQKKRRRALVWWSSIAAGLLALLSFTSGFWLSSHLERIAETANRTEKFRTPSFMPSTSTSATVIAQGHGQSEDVDKYNSPIKTSKSTGANKTLYSNKMELNPADSLYGKRDVASQRKLIDQQTHEEENHAYLKAIASVLKQEKIDLAIASKKMPIFIAEETVHQRRIHIGAQFSPIAASGEGTSASGSDMAYQPANGMAYVDNNKVSASAVQNTTSSVSTKAYSCGIPCEIEISKRIGLQTGLFMSMNQQMTSNSSTWYLSEKQEYLDLASSTSVQLLTSSNTTRMETNNLTFDRSIDVANTKLSQDFYYIEIPFLLKYTIIERRMGVFIQSGLVTGVLAKNTAKLENQQGTIWTGKTDGMNAMVFQSNVSLGLQFALSPKISIVAIPSFRYCLNGYSSNKNVYNFPISFGVYTGVNIKI